LGIAGCGEREDSQGDEPAMLEELIHRKSLSAYSNRILE
jgi:hypothetical protein